MACQRFPPHQPSGPSGISTQLNVQCRTVLKKVSIARLMAGMVQEQRLAIVPKIICGPFGGRRLLTSAVSGTFSILPMGVGGQIEDHPPVPPGAGRPHPHRQHDGVVLGADIKMCVGGRPLQPAARYVYPFSASVGTAVSVAPSLETLSSNQFGTAGCRLG